mmetsp:Transcript_11335/g.20496  ORF Transcript_11335/g.20496 Transcript_11335/m.20496 type:complete len:219 (-) Transcript_11335:1149-1805(-)
MGRRKHSTAFPVARIKKMMQSDEDVGKIATGAPLLVSKALELMLEDLIRSAAQVALQRKSRTISPQHLKECVHSHDAFDFLQKIFNDVPELDARANPSSVQPSASHSNPARTSNQTTRRSHTQQQHAEPQIPSNNTAMIPESTGEGPPAVKRRRGRPSKNESLNRNDQYPNVAVQSNQLPPLNAMTDEMQKNMDEAAQQVFFSKLAAPTPDEDDEYDE